MFAAGWEVRRLCNDGGGSVLRNTEAVGCGVGEVDVGVGGGLRGAAAMECRLRCGGEGGGRRRQPRKWELRRWWWRRR